MPGTGGRLAWNEPPPAAMTSEPQLQMPLHVAPLGRKDAEHHGIAHGAVAARLMMADDPVLLRAEGGNRGLRGEIEVVGAESHHGAAQLVECVAEQQ